MNDSLPITSTRERAKALSIALADYPHVFGSAVSMADLLEFVRLELGDSQALDDFCPRGKIHSKAIPPKRILHFVEETLDVALTSLVLGILAGSHNRVQVPSGASTAAVAVRNFAQALPAGLQLLIEIAVSDSTEWLRNSDAVIVNGADETIARVRSKIRPWQKFIAHGPRLSFAIILESGDDAAVERAAADVCLFDQHSSQSVHDIYVHERSRGEARAYAAKLSVAMREFNGKQPRRPISVGTARDIFELRRSYANRAASDNRVAIWQSENTTDWTVIYEEDPQFAVSCLNRLVFVKPLPPLESMPEHLRLVRPHLSSIAVWPCTDENWRSVAGLGATRVCALGNSHLTTVFSHQDGQPSLAKLVDWIDIERINCE